MTDRIFFRLALITSVSLWLACATAPARPPVTEAQTRAFDAAVAKIEGDPRAARAEFEALVRAEPQSALADDAAMRIGMLAFEQGDRDVALEWFTFVLREHADGKFADEARVRAATLEYALGNYEAANAVLARARFSQLTRAQRRAAFRVLVSTAPDGVAALRWLARLRADEIDERRLALVDAEIDKVLRALPSDDFERAADQIGRSVPSARVLLAAAERALDEGDLALARERVDRASRLPLAPDYASHLTTVIERIRLRERQPEDLEVLPSLAEVLRVPAPSTASARGTVGVVLPLSGSYAAFGLESLQGILLAAELFDETGVPGDFEIAPSKSSARYEALPAVDLGPDGFLSEHAAQGDGKRIRLLIRDSAGDPGRAAQAVRDLAADSAVTAIIGPLVKQACEAAADEAEAARIPLVALSSRQEVARDRPHVFRVRTRPDEEVALLVDHAIRSGAQTFAVLYPDDTYGQRLRSLFWEAVEERGGVVVGSESYRPDAVDFAEPIRRLIGYMLLTEEEEEVIEERHEMLRAARRLPTEEAFALREEARALAGPDEQALPPIVDFDALFIPDVYKKVVLIAPQLASHEAVGMRLLGTSDWYHPDLVSIGRDHVRSAVIAATFFQESRASVVEDFSARYTATFREAPDDFAAQAFDATNLVLVQLASGLATREAVRDGVLNTRAYPGVSGVLSIGVDGNARRRPFLLGIERGRFVEIE